MHAHRVYWPGSGNVTVERNIYFGPSAHLEGENLNSPNDEGELTPTPPAPLMPAPPDPLQTPAKASVPSLPPAPRHSSQIQKPSRRVHELMAGEGVTSPNFPPPPDLHDPQMPALLPVDEVEDVEEEGGAWFTCESEIVLLEDFVGFEEVLAVETSDMEALERARACLVPGNAWALKAPVLLLSVARETFEKNGKPNRWAQHDVGLATENLFLEAVEMGLAAHAMAGYDAVPVREEFGIPEGFTPIAMIAIGYPYRGKLEELDEKLRGKELAARERKSIVEIAFSGFWGRSI